VRLQLPQGEAGEYLALRPLDREIDETWDRFAIAAADEGISPDVLAEHIYEQGGRVVTAGHSDARLRPAGRRGLEWARANADREPRTEKAEAVRGR
jgi:hypothetical protein